jgi:hypothetical protein
VSGIAVGDRVVVNPMAVIDDIIGDSIWPNKAGTMYSWMPPTGCGA